MRNQNERDKKISITGCSGWGKDVNAFEERLMLTDHSISFKHSFHKLREDRIPFGPVWNREVKWSYKAASVSFSSQFLVIGKLVSELLALDPEMYFCMDADRTVFSITYSDGHQKKIEFWCTKDVFYPIWNAIRELIPPIQKMPSLLALPTDQSDETNRG